LFFYLVLNVGFKLWMFCKECYVLHKNVDGIADIY